MIRWNYIENVQTFVYNMPTQTLSRYSYTPKLANLNADPYIIMLNSIINLHEEIYSDSPFIIYELQKDYPEVDTTTLERMQNLRVVWRKVDHFISYTIRTREYMLGIPIERSIASLTFFEEIPEDINSDINRMEIDDDNENSVSNQRTDMDLDSDDNND